MHCDEKLARASSPGMKRNPAGHMHCDEEFTVRFERRNKRICVRLNTNALHNKYDSNCESRVWITGSAHILANLDRIETVDAHTGKTDKRLPLWLWPLGLVNKKGATLVNVQSGALDIAGVTSQDTNDFSRSRLGMIVRFGAKGQFQVRIHCGDLTVTSEVVTVDTHAANQQARQREDLTAASEVVGVDTNTAALQARNWGRWQALCDAAKEHCM